MRDNTHVPDKLEGYLLQTRHALFDLISLEPDRIVSVEAYDDVAFEDSEGLVVEQLKSTLSANNPLADRSVALWKAIYNWSRYISSGSLDSKDLQLKLVVDAAHSLRIGNIARSFNQATNTSQARKALRDAKLEIFGTADSPKTVSKAIESYITYCFAKENEAAVLKVIQLFAIDLHNGDYDEKLRERFNNQAIPAEYANELFIYMLGWVNEQIHDQINKNLPAYLSTADYLQELRSQARRYDLNRILAAVSSIPEEQEMHRELEQRSTYIRQLELINLDYTELFTAVSDFLRTRTEKIEWAKKGLVTQESIADYNDVLFRLWQSQSRIANIMIPNDGEKAGELTYNNCKADAMGKRLQGCDVPPFFGAGSLHSLADNPNDSPKIGWHPNYIQLLNEVQEDDK